MKFFLSVMILSIDIGRRNLGWCIGDGKTIEFGLYDIDGARGKYLPILVRTERIHQFLDDLFAKYTIETVIIEKQVNRNTVAMELMNLFVATAYFYCKNIVLYSARLKFTTLGIEYSTKGKAHKKLSVDLVRNYLMRTDEKALREFRGYKKKDDISDAVLMMLTFLYKNDKEELVRLREKVSLE